MGMRSGGVVSFSLEGSSASCHFIKAFRTITSEMSRIFTNVTAERDGLGTVSGDVAVFAAIETAADTRRPRTGMVMVGMALSFGNFNNDSRAVDNRPVHGSSGFLRIVAVLKLDKGKAPLQLNVVDTSKLGEMIVQSRLSHRFRKLSDIKTS